MTRLISRLIALHLIVSDDRSKRGFPNAYVILYLTLVMLLY